MLTDLRSLGLDIEFYMVLATPHNFTGKAVYKNPSALLHHDAVPLLVKATKEASRAGFRIKLYDAFRPEEAQEILWAHTPDPDYVMPPSKGSQHTRGIAVDVTLVDKKTNKELDMGTPVDDFTEKSHQWYPHLQEEEQKNRLLLLGIMLGAGFSPIKTEWWHYQINSRDYPLFKDSDLPKHLRFF